MCKIQGCKFHPVGSKEAHNCRNCGSDAHFTSHCGSCRSCSILCCTNGKEPQCDYCGRKGHLESQCLLKHIYPDKKNSCRFGCHHSWCQSNPHSCTVCRRNNECRSRDHTCQRCRKSYDDLILYDNPCFNCLDLDDEKAAPQKAVQLPSRAAPVRVAPVRAAPQKSIQLPSRAAPVRAPPKAVSTDVRFSSNVSKHVAGVALMRKNGNNVEILMQKTASWLRNGAFGLPGGSAQGSPFQTAINEMQEEAGLDLSREKPIGVIEKMSSSIHSFNFVFVASRSTWVNNGSGRNEVSEIRGATSPACYGHAWYTESEALALIDAKYGVLRAIIKEAFKIAKSI